MGHLKLEGSLYRKELLYVPVLEFIEKENK